MMKPFILPLARTIYPYVRSLSSDIKQRFRGTENNFAIKHIYKYLIGAEKKYIDFIKTNIQYCFQERS